jgi:hypothetical protein
MKTKGKNKRNVKENHPELKKFTFLQLNTSTTASFNACSMRNTNKYHSYLPIAVLETYEVFPMSHYLLSCWELVSIH